MKTNGNSTSNLNDESLTVLLQESLISATRVENREGLGRVVISSIDAEKGTRILREKLIIVWKADNWMTFFTKFQQLSTSAQDGIFDMYHPPIPSSSTTIDFEVFAAVYALSYCKDPDTILKLLSICNTNAHEYYGRTDNPYFEVVSSLPNSRFMSETSALFLYASKVAHSCNPNTSYSSKTADGCLEYKVIRKVSQDDMVTFSYLDKIWQTPTFERRKKLMDEKAFLCQCERCVGADYCRPHYCRSTANCEGVVLVSSLTGQDEVWESTQCGIISNTSIYENNELETREALDAINDRMNFNIAKVHWSEVKPLIPKLAKMLHPLHHLRLSALEMYARLCVTHAHQLEFIQQSGFPSILINDAFRFHGHPSKLRKESGDAGLQLVLAMECIASNCTNHKACYKKSLNAVNGTPFAHSNPVFDGATTAFHAAQDYLRRSPPCRSPFVCKMVQRYIPDMRLMFGENDTDVDKVEKEFQLPTAVQSPSNTTTEMSKTSVANAHNGNGGKKKGRKNNKKKKHKGRRR